MNLFRIIILTLLVVVPFYVIYQVTHYAQFPPALNFLVTGFLVLIFGIMLSLPLFFWGARRQNHKKWHDTYFNAGHFALAYVNFILVFVIIRDLFSFVAHYTFPELTTEILYGETAALAIVMLPLAFIILGTLVVNLGPKQKNVQMHFTNLPSAFENFRILHITDLHIGQSLPERFVERLIRKGKTIPDLDMVVYTGDILDGAVSRHQKELTMLKNIPSKYGNYYVPGNHEYYWKGDEAIEAFRQLGFHILLNQTEDIQIEDHTLQISGIPDPAARGFQMEAPDAEKLKKTLHGASFKVLLAHQPNFAPLAADAGYDLQLSGHTHGGQFFPWNFLIGFFQKYAKGLYTIGDMQLYVNQGTGYWGPSLRLGTYCEMAVIILKSKKALT
ncbi:MAG: metallophosphoesterase [Bdellovibrionaceae bacterium]|nr:metallophosphoesterase [Pseudobdellovibrionaceae bacterium]